MNVSGKFYASKATARIRARLGRNMEAALKLLKADVRRAVSTPGSYRPPLHSAPWGDPYAITKELLTSYDYEIDAPRLRGRYGSYDPLSHILEFGSYKMAPRPSMRRSVYRNLGTLGPMLAR